MEIMFIVFGRDSSWVLCIPTNNNSHDLHIVITHSLVLVIILIVTICYHACSLFLVGLFSREISLHKTNSRDLQRMITHRYVLVIAAWKSIKRILKLATHPTITLCCAPALISSVYIRANNKSLCTSQPI